MLNSTQLSAWTPRLQGVLRIVASYLLIQHGTGKLFDIPALGMNVSIPSLLGTAALIEIIGGALLLIGLFTRPVAFVLSGFTAVAYFMAHAPKAFFSPLQNGGELAVVYCFVFLFFSVAGAGAFSVDATRSKA